MPKTHNMPECTTIEEYIKQPHIKVGDIVWTNILGNPMHAEKYKIVLHEDFHLKYPVRIHTDFDLI